MWPSDSVSKIWTPTWMKPVPFASMNLPRRGKVDTQMSESFPRFTTQQKKTKHVEVEWKWHHNHIQHLNKPIKRTNKQLELSKHVSVSGLRDLSSHLLYPSQTPEPGEKGCLWQFPHPLGPPYCASQVMLPQQTETDRKIDRSILPSTPSIIIGTGCPFKWTSFRCNGRYSHHVDSFPEISCLKVLKNPMSTIWKWIACSECINNDRKMNGNICGSLQETPPELRKTLKSMWMTAWLENASTPPACPACA